jgi:indolepyruvate ferredoxin oxidoreductase alpha subunit
VNVISLNQPGRRALLMGNEAIARGALEGGLELAAAYPGTPSSEVVEALYEASRDRDFYVEWSINEKVAFEVAFGASLVGARCLCAMKNAGFNWVMDTFMTISYTGCKAGMLIVVADDPDAHYSSNEQDTRVAAEYNRLFCFEPSNQEEARQMAAASFQISERLELPVFLRSVTRISHASGDVTLGSLPEVQNRRQLGFNKHWKLPYRWNVYGPPGAVAKHDWLLSRSALMEEIATTSSFNRFTSAPSRMAVIASGLGASYADEAVANLGLSGMVQYLRLGIAYPLPTAMLRQIFATSDTVVVIEEGDPMVERQVLRLAQAEGFRGKILGKDSGLLKPTGEINTDLAEEALAKATGKPAPSISRNELRAEIKPRITPRSSTLCAGCPHLGSYWGLKKVLNRQSETAIVNGDIGCYEQAGYGLFTRKDLTSPEDSKRYPILSPYTILDTLYVMGSGIAMAQGQAQIGYPGKCLAVAGDSTFFHATMPALANAVANQADITFLILDNSWTAMTGHQPSPTSCCNALGNPATQLNIEKVVEAMGVQDLHIVDAYDVKAVEQAVDKAMAFHGPSVVLARGECMLQLIRRTKRKWQTTVVTEACTGCKMCLQLGCPAITFADEKAGIDRLLCVDCNLCAQVCPFHAIEGGK